MFINDKHNHILNLISITAVPKLTILLIKAVSRQFLNQHPY